MADLDGVAIRSGDETTAETSGILGIYLKREKSKYKGDVLQHANSDEINA